MTSTSLVPLRARAAAWPWERLPARHQPEWHTHSGYGQITRELAERAPLVSFPAIDALTGKLAQVARGEALLLQAGDCAERLDECSPGTSRRRSPRYGTSPIIWIVRVSCRWFRWAASPDSSASLGPTRSSAAPTARCRRFADT